MTRVLVTGGARSGKSRWAEARIGPAPARYLATGYPPGDDAEWAARVRVHRQRRPAVWQTLETLDVAAVLRDADPRPVVVDCVTLWLTRTLDGAGAWDGTGDDVRALVDAAVDELVAAFRACPAEAVLVTNEVGSGVVAPTPAGRLFADLLGETNARLAEAAELVVLTVSGLPLTLKPAHRCEPTPGALHD